MVRAHIVRLLPITLFPAVLQVWVATKGRSTSEHPREILPTNPRFQDQGCVDGSGNILQKHTAKKTPSEEVFGCLGKYKDYFLRLRIANINIYMQIYSVEIHSRPWSIWEGHQAWVPKKSIPSKKKRPKNILGIQIPPEKVFDVGFGGPNIFSRGD